MGGTISTKGVIDPELKDSMAKITVNDVYKLKELIDTEFSECVVLNKDNIEYIFSDKLDQWETLYTFLKDNEGKCDLYQVLAVISTFSMGTFLERQKLLFSLFDFDCSGDVSLPELLFLFSSCITGLCLLTKTKPPDFESIKIIAGKAWNYIDADFSGCIDLNEFIKWLDEDEEIQEFLIHYQNFQTRDNAYKLYQFFMDNFIQAFTKSLTAESDNVQLTFKFLKENNSILASVNMFANIELLIEAIKSSKAFKYFNYDDFLVIVTILKSHGKQLQIHHYTNIIRAVSSFLSTDINNDKVISYSELKTLLWLIYGEEPSDQRVKMEQNAIDINKDDGIQLKEWIDYLLVCDTITGVYYLDHKMRLLFDKYDKDKSGFLSKEEVSSLVYDSFEEEIANLDSAKRELVIPFLKKMIVDIIKNIDLDSNCNIEWTEFKKGISLIIKQKEYIDKIINVIKI